MRGCSAGKSTTTSPNLNLDLNLDPQTLFTVTRSLAVKAGLPTEQLDGIVTLGGYHYLSTTSQKREVIEAEIAARSLEKRDNIYTCAHPLLTIEAPNLPCIQRLRPAHLR